MTTLDILWLATVALALLFDHFVLWRAFLRWVARAASRARRRYWSIWMAMMWTLVAGGALLWRMNGRDWRRLGFTLSAGWGLWVAAGVIAAFGIVQVRGAVQVQRSPRARSKLRVTYAKLETILPHTFTELYWFLALSITAGFCEEFIFRGYLIWTLRQWMSWWPAAAISAVIFAAGHSYQGMSGILRTGILGVMLTVVLAISGSLWPGIVLHALIDISSGAIAWLVLREQVVESKTI
jgi:uncharacterized protein